MYGSNFCSGTLQPRSSSSMPIEAAGQPLAERGLTTPPVTKMCTSQAVRQVVGSCHLTPGSAADMAARGRASKSSGVCYRRRLEPGFDRAYPEPCSSARSCSSDSVLERRRQRGERRGIRGGKA